MLKRSSARRCTRVRIGRVSVYLHHRAWWIYYRAHGQQVRRRIGTDRAEAERVAAEVNAQISSAAPSMFGFTPINIEALRADWLAYHEHVLRSSPATLSRYAAATQHLVVFAASQLARKAHELSAVAFAKFLRARKVSPNGHPHTQQRLLRDKGVQFILEVCRSLYGFAARQRHLPPFSTNPFSDLRIGKIQVDDAKPIFVFDQAAEVQFLKAAKDWEFAVHFCLAKLGVRPGELCHLLIEDIDLNDGWALVRSKPEAGWRVKTRIDRAVPLIPEVREVVRRVVADRVAGPVFRRPRFEPTGEAASAGLECLSQLLKVRISLAVKNAGRDITRREQQRVAKQLWRDAGAFDADQIRRSFLRIAKRCGLSQATCPKSWRHSFATLLQDANVDPLLRQITLGHKPADGGALGMTAVYSHSRRETQAREITRALSLWGNSLLLARDRAPGGAHP